MHWDFSSNMPIYLQIAERLEIMIASGMIAPGEKLMSVRDLAIQAQVNPNTVQKAYGELERMGIVCSKRTAGRFVSDDPQIPEQIKGGFAQKLTARFLGVMDRLGYTKEDVSEMIASFDESNIQIKGEYL
ncbi:MAG: GntR family transcriptional regulator [Ruminococcus sp.]|nr:GntR family transcriptional regulator [Ruminococcus sp.]